MTLMPPNIDQFITLAEAEDKFKVSTKTLRRQRDKLRHQDDPLSVATFIVRTKDGEIIEKPTAELVTKLTKEGKVPEWLVNFPWLQTEYGPRSQNVSTNDQAPDVGHDQTGDTPSDQPETDVQPTMSNLPDLVREVLAAKDDHIADLKKRLDNAENEREAMREAAAQERSVFTRLLEPGQDSSKPTVKTKPSATTPKTQPVKQKSRPPATPSTTKATKPANQTSGKTPTKKKSRLRSWLRM